MSNFPRSPRLIKGALIEFSSRIIGPVPNVIIFQYNPESMSRSLAVWRGNSTEQENSSAQPFDPTESLRLELTLDATDALEKPDTHPIAKRAGVADRLAAIEMLMYPEQSLADGLMAAASSALGSSTPGASAGKPVPRAKVPVVLFAWGPGRIVPVRLTNYSIEEQAFSPTLYPIRATVSIELTVLDPEKDFAQLNDTGRQFAATAYKFTKAQKQALAASNLANGVESILAMLPI